MTRKELGKRLKVLREFRKKTQEELADLLGCDINTIYHYESGRRQPNIEKLSEIVKALDFQIVDVLTTEKIYIDVHDASEQLAKVKDRTAMLSDIAELKVLLIEIRDLLKRNASS